MSFNTMNTTTTGAKGSDVYTTTGVGDARVALSTLLVRGAEESLVRNGMNAILAKDQPQWLEDAFVLAFQTRDIRGGKGERKVSEAMWAALLAHPRSRELALNLLDLIPEYGCWRDLFSLADKEVDPCITFHGSAIHSLVVRQLLIDEKAMKEGRKTSLLAKWMPREERFAKQAKELARRLNPEEKRLCRRLASYRKRVSALNRYLNTVEIAMCGDDWDKIEPGKVPGRAVQKYNKAFLNETLGHGHELRHPDDEKRMACREHFQQHYAKAARGEVVVHGADTVFPHELIKKTCCDGALSQAEKDSISAVWNSMVAKAREGGGLGRSLAMCDFSGSMQSSSNDDTPYWVSMAIGLLISEVTTDEFKDTFLTFDSVPTIHTLPKGDIFERVASISDSLAQGTSTDFQKAMELVLQRLKASRCAPGKEPENLIVLTDMAWDQACGSHESSSYTGNRYRHHVKTEEWQTHVEAIRESFKRAGEDLWGEGMGWKMPTIVIWNISADCTDFHATADTEGVIMLSGWSPSLFKVLQTDGVVSWTPLQALRTQLDDSRYDPVRQRIRSLLA
jgi:hypothetical protein